MQQILRDLQEHGFEQQQRKGRWKDRRKAEEKRARNPCELKKSAKQNYISGSAPPIRAQRSEKHIHFLLNSFTLLHTDHMHQTTAANTHL